MNIIAIIPARGGSKGIPKKNIQLLDNKPLISYSIEEAKKSKYINRVIVSTDDGEIAEISRKYGAEVIKRPQELAQDSTPTLPVLKHTVETIEKQGGSVDIMVLLQPTSPLRKADHIDWAIEKLLNVNCDSVVSVTKLEHSPITIVKVKKDKLEMMSFDLSKTRRQDSDLYRINGAVYVIKKEILMKQKDYIIGGDIRVIIMSKEDSIDIDEPVDLVCAELLIKNQNKLGGPTSK